MRNRNRAALEFVLLACYWFYGALVVSHRFSQSGRNIAKTERCVMNLSEYVPILDAAFQKEKEVALIYSRNRVSRIGSIRLARIIRGLSIEKRKVKVALQVESISFLLDGLPINGYSHGLSPHVPSYALTGGISKILYREVPRDRRISFEGIEDWRLTAHGHAWANPSSLGLAEILSAKSIGSLGLIPLTFIYADGIDAEAEGAQLQGGLPPWRIAWFAVFFMLGWLGWHRLRNGRQTFSAVIIFCGGIAGVVSE